jgi:hypothetical protein
MRPTSVGLTSQRTNTLKNASRLPLRYRISLPSLANGVLYAHVGYVERQ